MNMVLNRALGRALVFGLLVTAAACDDDPLSPQEQVAGRYEMTTLLVTEGGTTFDALDAGADIEITLHRNGTTNGLLFVPGGDEDGSDVAADLSGTWTLSADAERVTFSHAADTFLRNRQFQVEGEQLVSNESGIHAVLSRN